MQLNQIITSFSFHTTITHILSLLKTPRFNHSSARFTGAIMQPNLANLCQLLSISSVLLNHAVFIVSSPTPVRAASGIEPPDTSTDLVPAARESLPPPPIASQSIEGASKDEPELLGALDKLLFHPKPSEAAAEKFAASRESQANPELSTPAQVSEADSPAPRQSSGTTEEAASREPPSPSTDAAGAPHDGLSNLLQPLKPSKPESAVPRESSPSPTSGGDSPASPSSRNATTTDSEDPLAGLMGVLKPAEEAPDSRESKPLKPAAESPAPPKAAKSIEESPAADEKDPLSRLMGVLKPAEDTPAPRESEVAKLDTDPAAREGEPAVAPTKPSLVSDGGDPLARLMGALQPAEETPAPRESEPIKTAEATPALRESQPAASPSKTPSADTEDPLARLMGVLQPTEEAPAPRESQAAKTVAEAPAPRQSEPAVAPPAGDAKDPLARLMGVLKSSEDAPAPRQGEPSTAPASESAAAREGQPTAAKDDPNPLAGLTQLLSPAPPPADDPVPAPRESQQSAVNPSVSSAAAVESPESREDAPAAQDEDVLGGAGKLLGPAGNAVNEGPKAVQNLVPFLKIDEKDGASQKQTTPAEPQKETEKAQEESAPPPSGPALDPAAMRPPPPTFGGGIGEGRGSMFDPIAAYNYRQQNTPGSGEDAAEDDSISGLPQPMHRFPTRDEPGPSIADLLPTVKNAISPASNVVKGAVPGAPGVADLVPNLKQNSLPGDEAKKEADATTTTTTAADSWITHAAGFDPSKFGGPGMRRRRIRRAQSPMVSYAGNIVGVLGTVAKSMQAGVATATPAPPMPDNPLTNLLPLELGKRGSPNPHSPPQPSTKQERQHV
ncbi:hypothetical protein BDV98DRAFT_615129 [Pterulicium gracile]|uniref:Uncharacterized protein n=1 Tax=Pterulicium gracile TaxID=1884261 RepID=A0A5C3R0D3_9AGAR|nr:hypothetical protein BDV98DRAFT_615129 [Pterula gracilis]